VAKIWIWDPLTAPTYQMKEHVMCRRELGLETGHQCYPSVHSFSLFHFTNGWFCNVGIDQNCADSKALAAVQ
jgi:hypothetical protein